MFIERIKDPTFATASKKGVYDETADRMIREAVIDNRLNIVHNYDHLCYFCCFIFGRYFGIRGGEELRGLLWSQVLFLSFVHGPYKGFNYVELSIDEDKGTCVVFLFFFILFYLITNLLFSPSIIY